jgi:hypothetical protein
VTRLPSKSKQPSPTDYLTHQVESITMAGQFAAIPPLAIKLDSGGIASPLSDGHIDCSGYGGQVGRAARAASQSGLGSACWRSSES